MGLREWVVSKEVCSALANAYRDGRVAEAADAFDKLLSNFGDGKSKVRFHLASCVILPFLKRLFKDDYDNYKKIKEMV